MPTILLYLVRLNVAKGAVQNIIEPTAATCSYSVFASPISAIISSDVFGEITNIALCFDVTSSSHQSGVRPKEAFSSSAEMTELVALKRESEPSLNELVTEHLTTALQATIALAK